MTRVCIIALIGTMGAFLFSLWINDIRRNNKMSKTSKSSETAFERRLKIYEKYGLKPIYVHKSGATVVFPGKHVVKGDK